MRAPFQILAIPYKYKNGIPKMGRNWKFKAAEVDEWSKNGKAGK